MSETWIPGATRIPGPSWKQGYWGIPRRSLAQIEGDIKHSAEGSWQGLLNILAGGLELSWTFSVPRAPIGNVRYAQHYGLESITYHAGVKGDMSTVTELIGNLTLVGIEHAGRAGTPLTAHQVAVTIEISDFLRDHTFAGSNPPELAVNLWEHGWLLPTACPSNRVPWATIIAALQPAPPPPPPPPPPVLEEEMILVSTTDDNRVFAFDGASFSHIPGGKFAEAAWGHDWANKVQQIPTANKSDPRHPYGDAKLPVFYPRGDASA
jgi:hypothetical protein